MKTTRFALSGLAALIVSLLIISCPMPTTPPGASGAGGSLTIQVGNHINSQTLLPPISMTPVSYTVSGTGPGGATFSQTTTGASVTVDHLAFGSWNITVNAMNADGTFIGSGNSTAAVHTGQTTTVAISVVPLTGNGTLNLTVSWTASQVEIPSIQASLTPPTGPATTLSFSVNGNQATYSSTSIPAGYQSLTVQLMDNNIAVMGAVEVVRIVAGQTTSGTYAFANVNQPGGTVVVNITPELADPIPVSISGVPATISAGTSITATASVSDGTTGAVYVWYLNGVSVGTGQSFPFGSALAAGYYRLDVTAYTATRAGSATASFQATSAAAEASGTIRTIAGTGLGGYSGDGGEAINAMIFYPAGIAVDQAGNIYFSDLMSSIRKIDTNGIISTIAGSPGGQGYSGDGGPATQALLRQPFCIVVDQHGVIYFSDKGNLVIRKIDQNGIISTVAGNGSRGFSGDGGPAAAAEMNEPYGLAFDTGGNLYIADCQNDRIRKIDAQGIISTVAGGGSNLPGDGGQATDARLVLPYGIVFDSDGNMIIVNNGPYAVRRIDHSNRTIVSLTASGSGSSSGDGGPAIAATFVTPAGIAIDGADDLYIADYNGYRIRKIAHATGVISTLAGNGTMGYSGDGGLAAAAMIGSTCGVAADSLGNIYLADNSNNRIRKIVK